MHKTSAELTAFHQCAQALVNDRRLEQSDVHTTIGLVFFAA